MTWIGHAARPLIARSRAAFAMGWRGADGAWGGAAVVFAVVPALWLWRFTVDDALIAVRYARHIAEGVGYRFNVGGLVTDGVTPLPWAWLLAPVAHAEPLVVLSRAKALGSSSWLCAAFAWGVAVGRADARAWVKVAAFVALGACVPVAAHAVSGMETGLAIALATGASLASARPRVAALFAGALASLRPELLPWSVVLAAGFALAQGRRARSAIVAGGIALAPFAACVAVRLAVFGHAAPLAVLAKPSDLAHGLAYVAAAALASLAPLLVVSPLALARAPRHALVIVLAGAVHLLAVVAVGGDWMPYARLVAPIVPSLLYAFVVAAPHARAWATSARVTVTLALGAYLLFHASPAARAVGADREALIASSRPYLTHAARVASLDIGWPTAATEADMVDLAGLTDPLVAALPGGHTSKRIDPAFLLARDPDVVLLYANAPGFALERWQDATYTRAVEARLAASPLLAEHYTASAFLPLGETEKGYVVLVRR